MTIIWADTPQKAQKGVRELPNMENTIMVFPNVAPNTSFHMQNVAFPIDIGAISKDSILLATKRLEPEVGTFRVPEETETVWETYPGFFKDKKIGEKIVFPDERYPKWLERR